MTVTTPSLRRHGPNGVVATREVSTCTRASSCQRSTANAANACFAIAPARYRIREDRADSDAMAVWLLQLAARIRISQGSTRARRRTSGNACNLCPSSKSE